jgi:hypothetical protein
VRELLVVIVNQHEWTMAPFASLQSRLRVIVDVMMGVQHGSRLSRKTLTDSAATFVNFPRLHLTKKRT